MRTTKEIREQLRAVRADMKRLGIKRTSCFNGGMDRQTQRFNEKCFALECALAARLMHERTIR
jgi:hypothetical protein